MIRLDAVEDACVPTRRLLQMRQSCCSCLLPTAPLLRHAPALPLWSGLASTSTEVAGYSSNAEAAEDGARLLARCSSLCQGPEGQDAAQRACRSAPPTLLSMQSQFCGRGLYPQATLSCPGDLQRQHTHSHGSLPTTGTGVQQCTNPQLIPKRLNSGVERTCTACQMRQQPLCQSCTATDAAPRQAGRAPMSSTTMGRSTSTSASRGDSMPRRLR